MYSRAGVNVTGRTCMWASLQDKEAAEKLVQESWGYGTIMVPPESGGLINLYGKVFSFACARVDGIQSEPTLKGGLDKISVQSQNYLWWFPRIGRRSYELRDLLVQGLRAISHFSLRIQFVTFGPRSTWKLLVEWDCLIWQ